MSSHKKISILGSGRVGSSIAYSLILEGLCSEIVLVDIAKELAQGESYAPDAIYIIVSNPVDVLTYAVQEITGLPKERVIGTGTLLDSSRLRSILAERAKVSPSNVHGYVFGEHGDSSFVPWSLTSIAGMPFKEGSFKLALKTGCPIIPIAMTNTPKIYEAQAPLLKKTHVVLQYGKPILPDELDADTKKHIGVYTKCVIEQMLEENEQYLETP